jgi:hypothetical protein
MGEENIKLGNLLDSKYSNGSSSREVVVEVPAV